MAAEDYLNIDWQQRIADEGSIKKLEVGKVYVVGFAFDTTFQSVLLISKRRPEDQVGKLNGAGGKVEPEDHDVAIMSDWEGTLDEQIPQVAMAREFLEETGIQTQPKQWKSFCELSDQGGWKIIFLYTTCDIWAAEQKTDEQPIIFKLELLHTKGVYHLMPNLNWLIPMALTLVPSMPITDSLDRAGYFKIVEALHA